MAFPQNPPPIRIGGTLTKSLYQLTLQSPNTDELYEYSPKLEAKLRGLPMLQDVTSDLQIKNPQASVEIDRDKASSLGITAEQVERVLNNKPLDPIAAPFRPYIDTSVSNAPWRHRAAPEAEPGWYHEATLRP